MEDRTALEQELVALASEARERRSVDFFLRAAVEALCWVVVTGVCAKLLRDSARTPIFFWPLLALDLYLLRDGIRSYLRAHEHLSRERRREARLRELRSTLGIDP